MQKKIATCEKKYGVPHSSQSERVKEKIKTTSSLRYGPSKYRLIVNKRKATCLAKFGIEHPAKLESVKQKGRATTLARYGTRWATQNKEVQAKTQATCLRRHGVSHISQCPVVKQKIREISMMRYGTACPSNSEAGRRNRLNTCLARYGVKSPMQCPEIKARHAAKCMKRYGVSSVFKLPSVRAKIMATIQSRYGVSHISHIPGVQEKRVANSLKRHGTEYPAQSQQVMSKIKRSAFTFKPYTMPSGKVIRVQGYEHFALNYLLNVENLEESQIVTGAENVPVITYVDRNGKTRKHFPDIWIPHQNRLVEVKSPWTASQLTSHVHAKLDYAKQSGYTYNLWVYNQKGKCVGKFD